MNINKIECISHEEKHDEEIIKELCKYLLTIYKENKDAKREILSFNLDYKLKFYYLHNIKFLHDYLIKNRLNLCLQYILDNNIPICIENKVVND